MTFETGTSTTTCKRGGITECGTITKSGTTVTFVQKIGVTLTGTELIDIGTYMNTL